MSGDDVLSQLAGTNPRRLLEDLARIGAALAKNERPRPEIEAYLASGQIVRGRIVSVAEDRQGAVAIVQVGGSPRAPSVTYVRVDAISAVTITDASLLVRAPISDAPPPSRLELQRLVAAKADGLTAKLGRALTFTLAGDLDEDGRRAVGAAVPVLADVIAAIAADELGKEALVSINAVELRAGASGDVTKEAGKLVVHAPKLITEQLTLARLRAAIEKLL